MQAAADAGAVGEAHCEGPSALGRTHLRAKQGTLSGTLKLSRICICVPCLKASTASAPLLTTAKRRRSALSSLHMTACESASSSATSTFAAPDAVAVEDGDDGGDSDDEGDGSGEKDCRFDVGDSGADAAPCASVCSCCGVISPLDASPSAAAVASPGAGTHSGMLNVITVPRPSPSLVAVRSPPMARAMARQICAGPHSNTNVRRRME